MSYDRNAQQYKAQVISTMTQGELLLLLYDELVKRLTQPELALEKQMFPVFEASIQRSVEIVDYLDMTLDMQ
ncbi:MAG: flagellar protein FliS, partial [Oscillospiraceae bacterium]|nr:flagellar protein FliS [Oscillospiraceae bacterium]